MDQNFHHPQVVNDEIIYFILQNGNDWTCYIFNIGENALLVFRFLSYFYFDLYFSILPLLVLRMKNVVYFGSYR